MATPLQCHTCPTCSYTTTLNFRMESHKFGHDFPKTQRLFDCANSIELLRCFRCASFETHELVALKQHFKVCRTIPEPEEKPYVAYGLRKKVLATEQEGSDSAADKTNNTLEFRCDQCRAPTKSKKNLERHILKKHTNPEDIEWFYCEFCLYKSKVKSSRDDHMKRRHYKALEFRCDQCGLAARSKEDLEIHILKKHTNPEDIEWFHCALCSYKGKMKSYRDQHVKTKHDNTLEFRCDQCGFAARCKEGLEKHILKKHTKPEDIQWFHCVLCSYKGKMKSDRDNHMKAKHDNAVEFRCDQCGFETGSEENLEIHILQKHTNPEHIQWFDCALCSYKSKVKSDRDKHMKCVHDALNFLCDQCGLATGSKENLERHILQKHTKPEDIQWFHCVLCFYKGKVKRDIDDHMKRVHDNALKFVCDQCGLATISKGNLERHILQKHTNPEDIQWFRCALCAYRSIMKSDRDDHMKTSHDNTLEFGCDQRGVAAGSKGNLKRDILQKHTNPEDIQWFHCVLCSYKGKMRDIDIHMKATHYKTVQFRCDQCGFETGSEENLQRHILHKHTNPEDVQWFDCGICSYKGAMKCDIDKHMKRAHHNRLNFLCDQCGLSTRSQENLERHILQKHTKPEDIQWFHCVLCSYKGKIESDRDQHVKTNHENALKFRCDQCGLAVRSRASLDSHILKKHTNPKDIEWFHCAFCSYKGIVKSARDDHMKAKHDNTLEFRCDRCGLATRCKEDLERHILEEHTNPEDIEWFHCALCSYKGIVKSDLHKHVKREHDDTLEFRCGQCGFAAKFKKDLKRHILQKHRNLELDSSMLLMRQFE